MKHLKLYEQFEDEEPWWDEKSPFDTIKDLRIIFYNGEYYIKENTSKVFVVLFDNRETGLSNDAMLEYIDLKNFSEDHINILYDMGRGNGVKKIKFKDLPKEIKDRII